MSQITNFGYLGSDFQIKVISQIMSDRTFGLNIIDIISPKYFDNQHYRKLVQIIKNYNKKFDNSLPTISGLKEAVLAETKDEIQKETLLTIIEDIKRKSLEDDKATQERALNFCKQQGIKNAITEISSIVEKGDFENYNQIEEILRKAMSASDKTDDSIEVTDDLDAALEENFRDPIPTGISGIDEIMNGGLGKEELAAFIAPMGCGKTSFLSKVANTAYNRGYNVVQLFFEDKKKDIQRKHITCWTGIESVDQYKEKEKIKEIVGEIKKKSGRLILKKCPNDGTVTTGFIKQYLRYLRNKGIRVDMLIIDYLDCIAGSSNGDDQNSSEALIMRQLESITSEFDLRTWVAIQTNRSGISAEVVTNDQIQGSIKRAQIAHIILTAARSLEQKENDTATMAVTKSRIGKDGVVFRDMTFNNSRMLYDTAENNIVTALGYEEHKKSEQDRISQDKAKKALDHMNKLRQQKNNDND